MDHIFTELTTINFLAFIGILAATVWYLHSIYKVIHSKFKKQKFSLYIFNIDNKAKLIHTYKASRMRNAIVEHLMSFNEPQESLNCTILTKYNEDAMIYTLRINGVKEVYIMVNENVREPVAYE